MNNFPIQPQFQPQMPPARSFGPATQPYLPRPDHRKRNLLIVICVFAAVMVLACILWISHICSASYKIEKGFRRLAKEAEALKNPMDEKLGTEELCRMIYTEGAQMETELDVTFDTFMGEVTFGVDTDYAKDMKKKKMSSATAFSVMNYEFGHLDIYADKDNICFSVPELFLEDLYLENENVLAQYNRSMWADDWLFGEGEGDDFSIDLFSAPWYFQDEEGVDEAFLNRYAVEIERCRQHMTMEKAGNGLYRIRFEGRYFNYLVWRVLSDYLNDNIDLLRPEQEEILGFISYFDAASGPEEIGLLLEMDNADRIESIRLEHPISLGRGAARIDGDIHFLGGDNSLEKIQGRIFFDNKEWEEIREQELVFQVVRSLEQGEYQMETEAKYSFLADERKHTVKLEGDFSYDGPKNSFQLRASAGIADMETAWEASGDFSHINRGESFKLELDEFRHLVNGEQSVLVRGEIDLGPLSRRIKQIAEPKTALLAMDEEDWMEILEKIDREYGYLWEMAEDYLR